MYTRKSFEHVEPCYTGGGVYIFTGKLSDGSFFMADDVNDDVRILNADPDEPTDTFGDYTFRNGDSAEWQEEHLVRDLGPKEAIEFFGAMLDAVIETRPEGNYLVCDMERIKRHLTEGENHEIQG